MGGTRRIAVVVVAVVALLSGAATGCTPSSSSADPVGSAIGAVLTLLLIGVHCTVNTCPQGICWVIHCGPAEVLPEGSTG